MAFFRKRPKYPSGTIERDDQLLIPEEKAPPGMAEAIGGHSFRLIEEWRNEPGTFVAVDGTAVLEAVQSRMKDEHGASDRRAVTLDEMNNPAHWLGDDDPPDDAMITVCRFDPSTGKLLAGPAMAEVLMGTSSFAPTEDEGTLQICICRESVMEEVDQLIAAMDYEITEEEVMALTYEVMDDPRHWTSHPDKEQPGKWGEGATFSFYPFDPTTGRIDRRD